MKTITLTNILLFAYGTIYHPKYPGGKYEVDEAFIDDMLHSHAAMTADESWYPAILLEHFRSGGTNGSIKKVYKTKEGLSSDWVVPEDVAEKIAKGEYTYRSPSFLVSMKHPHTGEELKHILIEVSFVSVPHQTNLPPLSAVFHAAISEGQLITHMEASMPTDNTTTQPASTSTEPSTEPSTPVENAEGEGSVEERVAKLEEGQAEILSILKEMKGEEGDEPADPPGDEPVDQSNQLDPVAHLEATIDVMHALPGADPETAKSLARLKVTDEPLYTSTLAIHQSQQTPQTGGPQPPIGHGSPGPGKLTEDQAIAEAKSKGHTMWPDQVQYIKQHHPHLADTINS